MGRDAIKASENMCFKCRKEAAKYNDRLYSREGAAELLGVSVSSLAEYETGATKVIPVDKIVLMAELYDMYFGKLNALQKAKMLGINTWVSFEPVLDARNVLEIIALCHKDVDKVKIGKLNYHASKIDWKQFGQDAEALCRRLGLDYYIKDSLRAEMEGHHG